MSVLCQALLSSAPIAAGWERMLTSVRNRTTLPANLRELAILRVAVLNRATFEFAVRATPWSDRVRPTFRNTKRTMFERV